MEANRIVYIRYLEDLQKTLAYIAAQQHLTDEADGATRAEARTSSSSSSGVPKLELFRASAGPPTAVTSLKAAAAMTAGGNTKVGAKDKPPGSDFVIARHVLDFGHVVSGTIKTLKFKVTNPALAGSGTLSWSFPKTLLADTGFSITPEKVVRLPEGASADFEVVLNAKTSIPLGRKEVELPIEGERERCHLLQRCPQESIDDSMVYSMILCGGVDCSSKRPHYDDCASCEYLYPRSDPQCRHPRLWKGIRWVV